MSKTCAVSNCASGHEDSEESVHFFNLPVDVDMQRKWEKLIPKTKEPLTVESLVCEKHFMESCIIRHREEKDDAGNVVETVLYDNPMLTETAVPSIFPGLEMKPDVEDSPAKDSSGLVYHTDLVNVSLNVMSLGVNNANHRLHHGNDGNGIKTQKPDQPEVSDQDSNGNPMNIDIRTIISTPPKTVSHDSTSLATDSPQPSGFYQNADNETSENSVPISGDSTSLNITNPPDVSTNNTVDSVDKITQEEPGWDDVIIAEPVSSLDASALFTSSDKVDAEVDDDCFDDNCYGYDCDGCACDNCGNYGECCFSCGEWCVVCCECCLACTQCCAACGGCCGIIGDCKIM